MLSYEHIYHAGNHADILKHIVLTLILEHLKKKPTPFSFIDTHAGSGVYALNDERALKTNESEGGIRRFFSALEAGVPPDVRAQFLSDAFPFASFTALEKIYLAHSRYAGSPEIARCLLRACDTVTLCELHPQAFSALKTALRSSPLFGNVELETQCAVHLHKRNGFELLSSLKPPARGVVLVDPSYEELSDFTDVATALCALYKRWRSGVFALWYPLTTSKGFACSKMREALISCVQTTEREPKILDVQLTVCEQEALSGKASLYGSGMMIINAPYKLDSELEVLLPALERLLGKKSGKSALEHY